MLFNEPKLLKSNRVFGQYRGYWSFSALQRAEIAEIDPDDLPDPLPPRFSALQRAEIAEMAGSGKYPDTAPIVSVLFNEPKLLKSDNADVWQRAARCFSALQRAEIAEIIDERRTPTIPHTFQCSSTSRNC